MGVRKEEIWIMDVLRIASQNQNQHQNQTHIIARRNRGVAASRNILRPMAGVSCRGRDMCVVVQSAVPTRPCRRGAALAVAVACLPCRCDTVPAFSTRAGVLVGA